MASSMPGRWLRVPPADAGPAAPGPSGHVQRVVVLEEAGVVPASEGLDTGEPQFDRLAYIAVQREAVLVVATGRVPVGQLGQRRKHGAAGAEHLKLERVVGRVGRLVGLDVEPEGEVGTLAGGR